MIYGSQEYWKTANTYELAVSDGGKLHVFAHSTHAAKIKGGKSSAWLKRTGRGNDVIIPNSVKLIYSGKMRY